jgi:TrpR family transcriptional regulator, trp operon repressor
MSNISEIALIFFNLEKKEDIEGFLNEIMTSTELKDLSLRWELMKKIKNGISQRKIASELGISLCKITRGSKILKNSNSVSNKILKNMEKE